MKNMEPILELDWERRARWALIALAPVFYLFLFPHSIGGDGFIRYEALQGTLSDGKLRPMLYSYVGPLISAPLYFLGMLVKTPFWWTSRFNALVFLAAAALLWRFFRRDWSPAQGRLFLLLLFCGSMFPKHVTDYYSEVFSASAMGLGIAALLAGRFLPGAALLCLSVWNGPGTLIGGGLVLAFFSWREQRWRYALLLLPMAAGIFLENYLKFGSLFPHSYLEAASGVTLLPYTKGPGFTYPLFFGLLSVLFSFGKGLAFFTPGLFSVFCKGLLAPTRAGLFLQAGLAYILGLLLVYSRWWAWNGDLFWGPRFFLFVSLWAPVALTVLWPTIQESAARFWYWLAATGLSIWVGCQGILYGLDFLDNCHGHALNVAFMCHYVPEYSPIWRVFAVWPVPQGRKVAYLVYFLLVFGLVLWRPAKEAGRRAWAFLRPELLRLLRLGEWRI